MRAPFALCASLTVLACTSPQPEPTENRTAPDAPPIEQPTVELPEPPASMLEPVPHAYPHGTGYSPPMFPEGPIPKWCRIELEVVTAEVLDRAGVCAVLDEPLHDCTTQASAWFFKPENEKVESHPVALLLPRGEDRFEHLVLAKQSLEEPLQLNWDEVRLTWAEVRSAEPLDASIVMSSETHYYQDPDLEDDDLAFDEWVENEAETHRAITKLSDGRFLIATANIDLFKGKRGRHARVVVVEDEADVWVCGGHVRLPLPEAVPPQPVAPTLTPTPTPTPIPTPTGPAPTPDETKAAGKRCGEGWSHFGAGDLAAAKIEVDAALTVLERADSEAAKRSLGACLYNRGRIAEQEGELEAARDFYRRSLVARPNDTVQARLNSL